MALNRQDKELLDTTTSTEVQVEDKARIKMKGKSAKASAKRNRGGNLGPAPVSSGNNKGSY